MLVRPGFLHRQINRLRSKQRSKTTSAETDLDAIGLDVDAASSAMSVALTGLVPGLQVLRNLTTALDQPALVSPMRFIANGIEDCPLIGKKGAKPVDHQALEIAGRDAAALEWSLAAPMMRDLET